LSYDSTFAEYARLWFRFNCFNDGCYWFSWLNLFLCYWGLNLIFFFLFDRSFFRGYLLFFLLRCLFLGDFFCFYGFLIKSLWFLPFYVPFLTSPFIKGGLRGIFSKIIPY